jgi:hypothetical protein
MLSNIFALTATLLSFVAIIPQLIKTVKKKERHSIPALPIAISLAVSLGWLQWGIRSEEYIVLFSTLVPIVSNLIILSKSKKITKSILIVPSITFINLSLTILLLEILLTILSLLNLIPHLRSALNSPSEISATRWLLEASEEGFWALWAFTVAAYSLALPAVIFIPVALYIAYKARAREGNFSQKLPTYLGSSFLNYGTILLYQNDVERQKSPKTAKPLEPPSISFTLS